MIAQKTFRRIAVKDWAGSRDVKNRNGVFLLPESTRDFYHEVLELLIQKNIPFLVGGAYAFSHYTGIVRHTKDLDIFVKPTDCEPLLDAMAAEGFKSELTFRHWIGKVWSPVDDLVDVIFGSGNGVCEVDDAWFNHAVPEEFLGLPVRMVACEEMIWSKGFILERNRFDGADVAHLIRAQGPRLDWTRLIERFGAHWRVLYAHIVLFGFIYPDEAHRVPREVIVEMTDRMRVESEARPRPAKRRLCRGSLFSHTHYAKDLTDWGYRDARLKPDGNMTEEDIRQWTAAFADDKP